MHKDRGYNHGLAMSWMDERGSVQTFRSDNISEPVAFLHSLTPSRPYWNQALVLHVVQQHRFLGSGALAAGLAVGTLIAGEMAHSGSVGPNTDLAVCLDGLCAGLGIYLLSRAARDDMRSSALDTELLHMDD